MVVFFFFFFSFSFFSFFSFPSSSSSSFSFFLYSPPLLAPLILASLLIFAFTREAFRLRQRRLFGPAVSKVEKKEERRRDGRDPDGIWTSIRRRVVIVSWFAVVFGSMAIRLPSVDYIRVTRIHRVICNLYDEAAAACVLFCNTDRLTGHP